MVLVEHLKIMTLMKNKMEINPTKQSFTDDRLSKESFTATTLPLLKRANVKSVTFYELDMNYQLVPFGSKLANPQSNIDIIILVVYNNNKEEWYAVELKHRSFGHNCSLVVDPSEGEILEQLKAQHMEGYKRLGFNTLWATLYNDGKFRLWFLNQLNIQQLPTKPIRKRKYSVKSSEYIVEDEYMLPADASLIIDAIMR